MRWQSKIAIVASALTASLIQTTSLAESQGMPAGSANDYAQLVAAAKAEGVVSIYTSTDSAQARGLLDAFSAKFPGIKVQYNDLGTNAAYNRVVSEFAAAQLGADIVWSSAMDLQAVLARDGYIDAYKSVEAVHLPDWAKYRDTLYATTVEPIGIIYNTRELSAAGIPKTRIDLIKFLVDNRDKYKSRIATFDPTRSGSGFLHHTNDVRATTTFWDLAKAFGGIGGRTYSSSGSMKETVVSGENVLAFNIIGSYALEWVKQSPNLGVAFGAEYTAAFSRVAAIAKKAPHPNAARLFLDFMLSSEGQNALASAGLPSVRSDVDKGLNFRTLNDQVGGHLRPIALDDELFAFLDQKKRVEFFRMWKAATGR